MMKNAHKLPISIGITLMKIHMTWYRT